MPNDIERRDVLRAGVPAAAISTATSSTACAAALLRPYDAVNVMQHNGALVYADLARATLLCIAQC